MALLTARCASPSKDSPGAAGRGAGRLISSAPLPRDIANKDEAASQRNVKPSRGFPRIELEDVEVTTVPVMVYFKIKVCPAGSGGNSHHVMKTYEDLQNLTEALKKELPETTELPKLPQDHGPCPQQAESKFMRECIRVFLVTLSYNREALETYSLQNFFQLSDGYDDQLSALRALRLNRTRSDTNGSRKPTTPQSPVPAGEAASSRPPQTEPRLDSTATGSDMPHTAASAAAAAAAVPKSAPGGLCKVGDSELSSAEYGSSAETSAGCSGSKGRKGRRRPWCIVCMSKPQEMAVDPCGHLSMCYSCSSQMKECPLCRGPIEKMLRIYAA